MYNAEDLHASGILFDAENSKLTCFDGGRHTVYIMCMSLQGLEGDW